VKVNTLGPVCRGDYSTSALCQTSRT